MLEPHLLSPLFILGWVTGGLADVHAEHDNLGGHGGHLVGEAVLVHAVHVCCKRVLAVGLTVALVEDLPIRTINLHKSDYLSAEIKGKTKKQVQILDIFRFQSFSQSQKLVSEEVVVAGAVAA